MSGHTKGPWVVRGGFPRFGHDWLLVRVDADHDDRWIAHVCIDNATGSLHADEATSPAEQAANARLIAAAPDIAEALEEALKYMPVDHPVHDMATAALALARGQEQERK